jgi:hypothetical protein
MGLEEGFPSLVWCGEGMEAQANARYAARCETVNIFVRNGHLEVSLQGSFPFLFI